MTAVNTWESWERSLPAGPCPLCLEPHDGIAYTTGGGKYSNSIDLRSLLSTPARVCWLFSYGGASCRPRGFLHFTPRVRGGSCWCCGAPLGTDDHERIDCEGCRNAERRTP